MNIEYLRSYATLDGEQLQSLWDELDRLRSVLHEISEEWAGAECGEPVYAQEAYAIALAQRMYQLAVEGQEDADK